MNKQRGIVWAPLLIIVGVIVVVGIVAYAVIQGKNENSKGSTSSTNTAIVNRSNVNIVANQNTSTAANTNTSINTNSTDSATDLTYANSDLGISFTYPSAWGPTDETIEQTTEVADGSEGVGKQIDFMGAGETSFGGKVQLTYDSPDFAPGREGWFGDDVGQLAIEVGIKNLCTTQSEQLAVLNMHGCTTQLVDGKWQTHFYGQIDALGGEEVLQFIRVFAFETGNPEFPAGALSAFLTNVNEPAIQTSDVDGVNRVYTSFQAKSADIETNQTLSQFDELLSTFQFTN
jgi:hypothetical protein